MAGEYPFINSPNSAWHDTGPSSATVARQMKTAARQRLQEEAASMTPDSEKLSEELMKYKISGGDRAQFVGRLNGMMSEYLNSYNENPYFAFTKKGRDISKNMQRLTHHPMLTALEESHLKNQNAYEQAQKDGLLSMVNVANGKVNVYNHRSNKFEFIDPSSIDEKTHEVLTAADAIERKSKRGFFNPESEYEVDGAAEITMASYKDVQEAINRVLTDPGNSERESFNVDLKAKVDSLMDVMSQKTKSNKSQLDQKAQAIFSAAGLPPSHWDTLLSNVYTKYRNSTGKLPSVQEAYSEAAKSLHSLIYSRGTDSITYDAGPSTARKNASDTASNQKVDLGLNAAFLMGTVGRRDEVVLDPKQGNKQAMYIDDQLWESQKDGIVPTGWLPLNNNKVFNAFVGSGEPVTTTDGQPLKRSGIIPAPNSQMALTKDNEGNPWITFDALVSTDALNGDWDKAYDARDIDGDDEAYIEDLGNRLEEAKKKNLTTNSYDPYKRATDGFMGIFRTDEYKRVRVKAKVNANYAQDMAHTRLDNDKFKVNREALSKDEKVQPPPPPVQTRISSTY